MFGNNFFQLEVCILLHKPTNIVHNTVVYKAYSVFCFSILCLNRIQLSDITHFLFFLY